jgi:ATP-dependent exoDNAse (exonuclease V) alpha subunit
MAIFRLDIKPVARSTGRTATAAAAYRAGERIRDERTGALYNHSRRDDVLHKEIFLPSRLERPDAGMEWARDRSMLWNAAEKAEQMSNSRVAREYQVALPAELSAEQRIVLARAFSREIADRYNVAVDLAIHAPRPEGDPRNFHAHLLATTREVTSEGMGPKVGVDMKGEVRSELGLPPSRQEFRTLRARWAELTNEALREANLEARVDHRTLEAQGIDRKPRPRLTWAAIAEERRGERNKVMERIRERHSQRQVRRAAGEPQQPAPVPPRDMDERRRQAVQDWLRYRSSREHAGPGHENKTAQPLSMDEIRRRAVAAWRSLQARGAESQPSTASRQERDDGRDRGESEQARDTPGLGDDFSG